MATTENTGVAKKTDGLRINLQNVRSVLATLSAPADVQLSWLNQRHFPVDELFQSLDDAEISWLPSLRRHAIVDDHTAELIAELLRLRDEMSDADLWRPEALPSADEWRHARTRAAAILDRLPDDVRRSGWRRAIRGVAPP